MKLTLEGSNGSQASLARKRTRYPLGWKTAKVFDTEITVLCKLQNQLIKHPSPTEYFSQVINSCG